MTNQKVEWIEGHQARRANCPVRTCPYRDLPRCLDWVQGWLDAHFEIKRLERARPRPLPQPPAAAEACSCQHQHPGSAYTKGADGHQTPPRDCPAPLHQAGVADFSGFSDSQRAHTGKKRHQSRHQKQD